MWGFTPRRRVLGLLAVALLAAGVGLAAHGAHLLVWLERGTVDARFSLRGREHRQSNIAIVGIDTNSLGELGTPQMFSRRLDARVLDHLHAAGARLIVFDIGIDRPSGDEAASVALYEAAGRAAPVVFATTLIRPHGVTEVLGGNSNLAEIGAQAGASNLTPDGDGVLRHLLDQVRGLPTLPAAVARRLTGKPANARELRGGWIDFRGPPGTFPNLSFLQVLQGHFDRRAVQGKVVVVGATAPALNDLHSTAAGSPMSGPEVVANEISTVLGGFPLRSAVAPVTILLIILLAVVVPLAGVRFGTLGVVLVGLGAFVLWSLAAQLAFNRGTVLDYSDPLAALLLGTGGTAMLGLWADNRERRRLREQFAADASEVVAQVLRPAGQRPLEPTAIIAGYRIEEAIGRGGMGVVYRATQLALDRPVAIKLIATERSHDPVFRERFKTESRIAASIEHPSVIPVYEAGEDDGLLFIAMRLVDGVDLARLIERLGPLEPTRSVRILGQLAGALDDAHQGGLVHRDVKPANVLLTCDQPEHAYLTDFGVARQMDGAAHMTRVGQRVGTLDYMAPEQIRGEEVDARSDIYALTGVLYHCLTGQTPFPRETEAATLWAHVSAPPPAPGRLVAGLPPALDDAIRRGMAKDPRERYACAAELARACAAAVGISESEMPAPPPTVAVPDNGAQTPSAASGSAPTILSG